MGEGEKSRVLGGIKVHLSGRGVLGEGEKKRGVLGGKRE